MMEPDRPTDDIVRSFQLGNDVESSFRILFRRHFHQVHWFFQRKGVPVEDARDLTQEVFLAVYKGLPELEEPAQFQGWLFVIARNVFHHSLEKQYAKKRSWAMAGSLETGRSAPDPDAVPDRRTASQTEVVLNRERVAKLAEALKELPGQMRRCFHLRVAEECSYQDIAVVMGISLGTVKAHIHKAREKLREELRPYFGD